jgi:hypothetical protein
MRSVPRTRWLAFLLVAALAASAWAAGTAPVARRYDPNKAKIADGPIVHLQVGQQRYDHVSLQQYKDLRNASIALMKKYPPDQHVYVGLGRDPAPFIAFLQEIGAEAHNFPASGQGHAASALLDRHFQQLIPAHVRNGTKKIVLIDQTRSGKTHQSMMPLLKDWLKRTGSSVQVTGVAFNQAATVSLNVPGLSVIDTRPFPEVFKFFYAPYEGIVSPFERHTPSTQQPSALKWRPQYDSYRKGLGQRIERDPELDKFLAPFAPNANAQQAQPAPPPRPTRPAPQPNGKPSRELAWKLTSPFTPGLGAISAGATLSLTRKKQTYNLLDKQQYESLKWGAQELLRRHPPSQGRTYIGVGRSASPLVAFLENLGAGNVGYLPSDGLKNDAMTPQLEAAFHQYFAKFIPRSALTRGDTITLFQQSDSGKTLTALKPVLQRYIAKMGSSSKVELVAFSTKAAPNGVARIDTRGQQALQELNGDTFKTVAYYTYHRVGSDALGDLKRPRGDYGQFKQALLDRMQRDQALDDYLQKPE